MWFVLKRLSLAFTLLLLCSGLLLYSDWTSRKVATESQASEKQTGLSRKWKITFITFVTSSLVEEAVEGTTAGLKEAGLVEGRDYESQTFSAQGDIASLNSIVDASLNSRSDIIYTYTTPALQAVTKKAGNTSVVFTLAVDPASWGFRKKNTDRITGIYVSVPAERMIRMIRECLPNVRKIGTLFTPSESNSTFVLEALKQAAAKDGIEVVARPAASSAEVPEAADSLVTEGVDAICQIPDNNTGASFVSIARAATKTKTPLFCFGTPQVRLGGAVAVAVDGFESGRQSALIAARIMRGENAADIPMAPGNQTKIVVNPKAIKDQGWTLPESVKSQADEIIQEDGTIQPQKTYSHSTISRKWNIHLLQYSNFLDAEESEMGIRDGFREQGLVENREYRLTVRNAQGDMVTLNSLIDSAITDRADMVMTLSTATLQSAMKRVKDKPVVFTLVASPVAAGAGRSNEDHLPNVTGVATTSAYEELIAVVRKCLPHAKRLGTLYVPSETNSIYNLEKTEEAARKAGFELIALSVNTSAEVTDATQALLSKRVDAICQIAGNLTASAFPSIAEPARRSRIPIFAFQTNQAEQGASVVVARDYYDGGRQAAEIAVRVMKGENPAAIPFQPLKATRLLINRKAAEACNLKIPAELSKSADRIL